MNVEEAKRLREQFPAGAIGKLPKGGVMLEYVGHAATTDRLLQVDPEWAWEPFALDERGLPALDAEGNLWIRLTVCGVTRPGVGDGKNAKERIGDAIRNAAMRFGVALDLWAKEDLHAQNGDAPELREPVRAAVPAESEGAPSPSDSPDLEPPTGKADTKKKLNALVGSLRNGGHITTVQIYNALATSRNVEVETMIGVLEGARDEAGELHWAPLRDSMTKQELLELHGRLARLWVNVQPVEAA